MEKSKSTLKVCLIAFPLLLLTAIALYNQNPVTAQFFERWSLNHRAAAATGEATAQQPDPQNTSSNSSPAPPSPDPTKAGKLDDEEEEDNKRLFNGLLAAGFDENSCLSRYQSYLYRNKPSSSSNNTQKPSPTLIAKLRRYESLHRKCGPGTLPYKKSILQLAKKSKLPHYSDCKYIIWLPANGLGNRMISLTATFLYALLTDRILLAEFPPDMSGLFCQPFLNSTWESPTHFSRHHNINLPTYQHSITTTHNNQHQPQPILFLDLQHHTEHHNTYFHCNSCQNILNKTQILIIRSDQYFVPSLFITPYFHNELNLIFPKKETIFHFLSNYLFHPTNKPWGLITRFYQSYLTKPNQRIGLQIRLFTTKTTPKQTILNQILSCTLTNNILPPLSSPTTSPPSFNHSTPIKALLVTSLHPEFSDNLRNMYWSNPTQTGELIQVFQPTHEGTQKFNNETHQLKALVEIYLLSLCDVLVTSGLSTFGYVAQGLGGFKSWIMSRTVGVKFREPACQRVVSIEPCFHFPPDNDCTGKKMNVDQVFGSVMSKCRDWSVGVKLIDYLEVKD